MRIPTETTARRDGAGTARELLDAAAKLFWAKGYAATTTRELADAVGVQKASLYYYIDSKEDLLYDICVESLVDIKKSVTEAVAYQQDCSSRVRAMIRAHVMVMLREKEKHATMLTELDALTGDRRAEVVALRDDYDRLVRGVLEDAQRAGVLSKDMTAKELELCLMNLLNGTIFWYREDGGRAPDQLVELFERMFLGGAGVRGPSPFGGRRSRKGGSTRPKGCG
jgi:AcrR family transcriptional regulator